MSAGEQTAQQVRRLVRELGCWRRDRREAAQQELAALGQDALEPLLATTARDVQTRAIMSGAACLGYILSALFRTGFSIARHLSANPRPFTRAEDLLVLVSSVIVLFYAEAVLKGHRVRRFFEAAPGLGDIRLVGPLIDGLPAGDTVVKRLAAKALVQMLPRLTPQDSAIITAGRQRMLCSTLMSAVTGEYDVDFNPRLATAILHALEQVGDAEALATVRYVADMPARMPAKLRVREAARRVLPVLEERAERAAAGRLLLRAADGPPGTLLRPASASDDTPPEQLLRPSTSDTSKSAADG